jgi:hypothetical protein
MFKEYARDYFSMTDKQIDDQLKAGKLQEI